jgi:hypothetical protein
MFNLEKLLFINIQVWFMQIKHLIVKHLTV